MAADLQPSMTAALAENVDVAIAGAGTMGRGIAQVAALAGHRIYLFDSRRGVAQQAVDSVAGSLDKLVAKQRLTLELALDAQQRLQAVETLEAFAGCGVVIEAILEDLEAKRTLFRGLEAVTNRDTIFATNTSSISVTAIGAALQRPQRLAGFHFFNPAPVLPLVEVVSGLGTDPSIAAALFATAMRWGKVPVHARSTPGFIVNRVARPFYAEALLLLRERAADCATLDAILRDAGGFRMGPFELMDLIGLDVNYAVTQSVFNGFYGDPRFTPSALQLELVEAGFLGRKSGRGFYDYAEGATSVAPKTLEAQRAPTEVRVDSSDALGAALTRKLSVAGFSCGHLDAVADERIAEGADFALYRTDGRTATTRAAANGIANTVLVDLALEEDSAPRLALAFADQSSATGRRAATGLLQSAGYAISAIDDVPGMIVMRTVAMLANEAADAVNQGVCSVDDANLAMRKGVNYPRGPLEWADALGLATIVQVLDHLAESSGESRYRVSPLLRRKLLSGARFTPTLKVQD